MHRFLAAVFFCLVALTAHPVRADVTGARVVSIGEMDKGAPQAPQDGAARTGIEGRPGLRFGMELVPEGTPQGAPVVLEARLKRPDDPQDAPPMRWLVAARIGIPVLSVWEFAYDWEVEPGVWTMTVSHEDAVLATASFMVVQPDPQAQAQTPPQSQPSAKPSKPGEPRQDKKTPDSTPAKSQTPPSAALPKSGDAKTSRPETAKPDAAPDASRQDAGPPATRKQPEPAGSTSEPKPDRPAKPLPDVQGQGRTSSNGPAAASGKRVQVLVAGVYSEEARALWVAAFLQKRGVKACVRADERSGKKRWSLVAGWRDTPEEARRAKDELAPTVGEIVIVSMSAAELEKGLQCR
ncbi:MAG: hypothetical protein ACLGSA_01555 [Acidobacteriota bacterium]